MIIKWAFAPIGILGALIAGAMSIYLNFTYGQTVMTGAASLGIAITFVCFDVLKMVVPTILRWGRLKVGKGGKVRGAALGYLFVFFACVLSFASTVFMYQSTRQANIASRLATKDAYATLQKKRAEQVAALESAKAILPRETALAELNAMKQNVIFGPSRTKGCVDATLPDSRTFCERYERVKGKLLNSQPVKVKNRQIAKAVAKIEEIDAKIEALSLVTVHDAAKKGSNAMDPRVNWAIGSTIALLIELATTAILALAVNVYSKPASPKSRDLEITPVVSRVVDNSSNYRPDADDNLITWIDQYVETRKGNRIQATEFRNLYNRWASMNGHEQMNATIFGRKIKELGIVGIKSGGLKYYQNVGVRHMQPERPQLELVANA